MEEADLVDLADLARRVHELAARLERGSLPPGVAATVIQELTRATLMLHHARAA